MGIGAGISGGCNLGHSLVGVPLLSLGSLATTLSMVVGVWVRFPLETTASGDELVEGLILIIRTANCHLSFIIQLSANVSLNNPASLPRKVLVYLLHQEQIGCLSMLEFVP